MATMHASPVDTITRTLHEAGLFKTRHEGAPAASTFCVHATDDHREVEVSVSDHPIFRTAALDRISLILREHGVMARRHDRKPVVVATLPKR